MRALTTFDVAIYSIIYSMATGATRPPFLPCEKVRKRNVKLFKDDVVGKLFAELTLIAFGEKFHDDEVDNNGKRMFFLNLFFGKSIRKAQKNQPKLAEISKNGMDKINTLQNANANVFEVLGAYGNTFCNTFEEMGIKDPRYLEVFKAIAEWTFFVDMICDYEEDYKDKTYNAFYDEECPTLEKVFDKKYLQILEVNSNISNRIINSLNAVNDDSIEWKIVYRILEYSLNSVVSNLLSGGDVKFHYFKELKKNWKLGRKNENKSNFS
ncbi:MAG: hypothetical protein J6V71_01165 [Clostridia bacterium]|nr:hypothetical protein [Clostridia bacterium]